ncbi:hypothetical protein GCM10025880_09990 [Methylorubrum aminovorans]|nr:hypothetical protein GCM10025880_09990 [Methylorubrum aminovorans]
MGLKRDAVPVVEGDDGLQHAVEIAAKPRAGGLGAGGRAVRADLPQERLQPRGAAGQRLGGECRQGGDPRSAPFRKGFSRRTVSKPLSSRPGQCRVR